MDDKGKLYSKLRKVNDGNVKGSYSDANFDY